mgnify:CR=1 FL=1
MIDFKIEGTLTNDSELELSISHNIQDSKNPTVDMTLAITHAISELCARSYDEDNYEGYAYLMTMIAMTLGTVTDRRVDGKLSNEQLKVMVEAAEQNAQVLSDTL